MDSSATARRFAYERRPPISSAFGARAHTHSGSRFIMGWRWRYHQSLGYHEVSSRFLSPWTTLEDRNFSDRREQSARKSPSIKVAVWSADNLCYLFLFSHWCRGVGGVVCRGYISTSSDVLYCQWISNQPKITREAMEQCCAMRLGVNSTFGFLWFLFVDDPLGLSSFLLRRWSKPWWRLCVCLFLLTTKCSIHKNKIKRQTAQNR